MALSNLFGWKKKTDTNPAAACGTACGAGDKAEEKPAACGTACGAGDKAEENIMRRMASIFLRPGARIFAGSCWRAGADSGIHEI